MEGDTSLHSKSKEKILNEQIVVDVSVLTMVIAPIIPIVVGLVTKAVASQSVKAIMLLALSAVTGVVDQAIANNGILTKETIISSIMVFVIAVATHYGLLKPTGVTGTDGIIQQKTQDIGVG